MLNFKTLLLEHSEEELMKFTDSVIRNPAPIIRMARMGSSVALESIAFGTPHIPGLLTEEVLEIYLAHLNPSKIPRQLPALHSDPNHPDLRVFRRAYLSIMVIARFFTTPLVTRLHEAWPGFFAWLVAIDQVVCSPPPDDADNFIKLAAGAIIGFFRIDEAFESDMVLTTPGLPDLAMSLWGREPNSPDYLVSESVQVCCELVEELLAGNSALSTAVLEIAGRRPTMTARIVLSRLRAATQKRSPPSDMAPATLHLKVIAHFVRDKSHPLFDAILERHGVSVVTQSIHPLHASLERGDTTGKDGVTLAFQVLRQLITASNPIRWVLRAVLDALFTAYPIVFVYPDRYGEDAQQVMMEILDVIEPCLVYGSLVDAIARFAGPVYIHTNWSAMESSPLQLQWLSVVEIALRRAALKHKWDLTRDVIFCDTCGLSSPMRAEESSTTIMKRCAQCQTKYYCSEKCQKNGWDLQHKAECEVRSMCQIRESMSRQDRRFLQRLVLHEVLNALPALRVKFDDPALSSGVIGLDCKCEPTSFSVIGADEVINVISESHAREIQLVYQIVDGAKQSVTEKRTSLFYVTTTLGSVRKLTWMHVSPAIWDAKDVDDFRILDWLSLRQK
ncbi:hypothetical protein FA95DRAFT_1555297 [Auriscalpium vulgare]|uniref:Uncharacterized protein n=1 Tax=Auriscalpium vulgare TaxID=40419 RepID=A0ACB8S3F9_9AGAM|nr:hypothetical protein FA95DRAFT_1555297 [Auriscalpium vulgare]